MLTVLQQNYFSLFGLPQQYPIDLDSLSQAYKTLQQQYHPDRFVCADSQSQAASLQIATYANQAYQTLKHDTERARYLLQLHGIDSLEESNTAMSPAFLMQQMEWREALDEATQQNDMTALMHLATQVRNAAKQLKQQLQQAFSAQQLEQAASLVRELSFMDKMLSSIQQQAERF